MSKRGFINVQHRAKARGELVLEVLASMAAMWLVAAIAVPSYTQHLHRSARAQAQSFLASAAATQQRFLSDRRRYAANLAALDIAPPIDLAGKYTFAVAAIDGPAPAFTLTAIATGGQAADACPTLRLDSHGGKSPNECW
jgi:type IV pilus assembly protein PilE